MKQPKLFRFLLGAIAAVCLTVPVFATTTVTGKMQTLGTTNLTNGAFMRFYLRGCAGNQPRVNGTALIGPTQGGVFYMDFAADSSGNVSGTLYSTRDNAGTGNGDIECGGSRTSVWYGMQAFIGGRGGPEVPVHAKSGVSLDITSVTPITTNPVVTAPSGDGTYLRLDNGNNGTGGTTFTRTADKLSAFAATTSAELAGVLSDETGSGGGFMRATGPTTTSPVINGTPSGTGIPTITLKKGSGAGFYTAPADTNYHDVDGTNLSYTVTIPTGWKLAINVNAAMRIATGTTSGALAITDSSVVAEEFIDFSAVGVNVPISLNYAITGDGNSHTIKLQFKNSNASNQVSIDSSSSTRNVMMLLTLMPAN